MVAPPDEITVEVEVTVEVAEGVPIEVVARLNDLDRRIRSVEATIHQSARHGQEIGCLSHRLVEGERALRLVAAEQHMDLIDNDRIERGVQLLQGLPVVAETVSSHQEDLRRPPHLLVALL